MICDTVAIYFQRCVLFIADGFCSSQWVTRACKQSGPLKKCNESLVGAAKTYLLLRLTPTLSLIRMRASIDLTIWVIRMGTVLALFPGPYTRSSLQDKSDDNSILVIRQRRSDYYHGVTFCHNTVKT